MNNGQFDTDVLIVGSGPTGITVALALATYGVRAHVVSMWNWLAHTPRAHITNQRAMEVLRDLGLESQILEQATSWELMGDTPYATSLAGEELVRQRTWGTGDKRNGDYLQASPCGLVDIIQPTIEPILHKNAAERGASFAFNTEYLKFEEDADGVTVFLRERLTGREYTVRARYLIGADGARSSIAEQIDLPVEGQMARAGTVYTIFEADLARYAERRPSILNWIVSPDASFGEIGMGLLRAVVPWTRWIAGWGFDISKGDPDLSNDFVVNRIKTLIGDPDIDVKVINSSVWYVNQAYATQYSRGRVFCGGDAVHRHPPSSGLGLNTCVQDAFNLAWKLAYVINGFAGQELLESYSLERAPVGKQIVERANQSRLDYAPLNACFRVQGAENPVAEGIKRFRDPGPDGQAVRKAVLDALRLKDTEFNALGLELNQRYTSSAVLADGTGEETFSRDPVLHLQASTRPGAKLPHAWLVDSTRNRLSTLDVVGKGMMTLITGLAGEAWASAAERLALPYLKTVVVGTPDHLDLYCDWQEAREVDEDGAVLVRPDGYVAWRRFSGAASADEAESILREVLGHTLSAAPESHSASTFRPNFGPHLFG